MDINKSVEKAVEEELKKTDLDENKNIEINIDTTGTEVVAQKEVKGWNIGGFFKKGWDKKKPTVGIKITK